MKVWGRKHVAEHRRSVGFWDQKRKDEAFECGNSNSTLMVRKVLNYLLINFGIMPSSLLWAFLPAAIFVITSVSAPWNDQINPGWVQKFYITSCITPSSSCTHFSALASTLKKSYDSAGQASRRRWCSCCTDRILVRMRLSHRLPFASYSRRTQ